MAHTPQPEAGPSSAKARGKAPARFEEEEEEVDSDSDMQSVNDPAKVRAGLSGARTALGKSSWPISY